MTTPASEIKKQFDYPAKLLQEFLGKNDDSSSKQLFYYYPKVEKPAKQTSEDLLRKFIQILALDNIELLPHAEALDSELEQVISSPFEKKELKEFAENFSNYSSAKPKPPEGSTFFEGHTWLGMALSKYASTLKVPFKQLQVIAESYTNIKNATRLDHLAHRFKEKSLISLVAGFKGDFGMGTHCTGLSLFGDRLIYTNTGDGSSTKKEGTYIYQINKDAVDKDYLNKLFTSDHSALQKQIQSITTNEEPIFIPAKAQKIGNCAISNPKKNIRGILACLIASELPGGLNRENIQKAVPSVNVVYKNFTKAFREGIIDEMILLCNKNIFDINSSDKVKGDLVLGLVNIICNYITKQNKKLIRLQNEIDPSASTIKKVAEIQGTLCKLWVHLPKCYQAEVLKRYPLFSDIKSLSLATFMDILIGQEVASSSARKAKS